MSSWSCGVCTFTNSGSSSACEMCGTPGGNSAVSGAASSSEGWSCPVCTFANAANRPSCEMCGTPNPSAPEPANQPSGPSTPAVDPGNMTHKKIPRDNNCLFHCYGLLLEGQISSVVCRRLRNHCAETIAADTELYSDVMLGQTNAAYCDWIRNFKNWGGEIEIQILCNHFNVETVVVPWVGTPLVLGSNSERKGRIYLLYTGQHYDAMAASEEGKEDQCIFPVGDEKSQADAVACAVLAKQEFDKRLRQRVRKALQCECGAILADNYAFQDHCATVEHDEDFSYDIKEIEIVEDGDAPVPEGATDLKDAYTFANTTTSPLSNLYASELVVEGKSFPSLEHYWKAMSFSNNPDVAEQIRLAANVHEVDRLSMFGGRDDWEDTKADDLLAALRIKFCPGSAMLDELMATQDQTLVCSDNRDTWLGLDTSSGIGLGRNTLGKLLMQIRLEQSSSMETA